MSEINQINESSSYRLVFPRAVHFAARYHGDQKYGERLPYTKHLLDVDTVLIRFGFENDHRLRVLAYLHDVLEDTAATLQDIEREFGVDVSIDVYNVTDGNGKNRHERKQHLFTKLVKNPEVLPVKLADRIANIEWSILTHSNLLKMYIREHAEFERNLRNNSYEEMWIHLNYLMRVAQIATLIEKPF